mmetsp:Transcript_56642/g.184263  ORF Transcript_56642/g.184263 Transcript_56642/m.184263 type:complete len:327 (+) Transcript_56642:140-1120(+)
MASSGSCTSTSCSWDIGEGWQDAARKAGVSIDKSGTQVDAGDRPPSAAPDRIVPRFRNRQGSRADERTTSTVDSFVGKKQVMMELHFAELWPGAIDAKLGHYGVSEASIGTVVVVTDYMGVEIESWRNARMPESDRFPLKLHFRAAMCGPQNLTEDAMLRLASLVRKSSVESMPWSFGRRENSSSAQGMAFEHSVELAESAIMSDVIGRKLESIGCPIVEGRPVVLVTDCLGVFVDLSEGVPEIRRFPIKLHFERTSKADQRGSQAGSSSWLRRIRSNYASGNSSSNEKANQATTGLMSSDQKRSSAANTMSYHFAWQKLLRRNSA